MKSILFRICMASAVQVCLVVSSASAFTFDDVHAWVGDGTNRAVVVIDWNNGIPGSSIAYGVRWNGASTNIACWLRRLDDEDRRLAVALSANLEDAEAYGFAYDADGDGGAFDMNGGRATDSDDFIAVGVSSCFWAGTRTNAVAFAEGSAWTVCAPQLDALFPVPGDWVGFRYVSGVEEGKSPSRPSHAESPYAFEIVSSYTNPEEVMMYGPEYANLYPKTVLGRPSSYCPGWEYQGYVFPDVNITPHSQAYGTNQVFSMASLFDEDEELLEPGSVTVKFDHKVLDDPQNPFGLDLIVFGNAFLYMGEFQYFDGMADPNGFFDETSVFDEKPGLVEVSQDGVTWYAYQNGPWANTFAPTISHLYDTNEPDASLFAGNQWWGKLADPTLPVDPARVPSDFSGRSIADYAALYNGSSGGTGFDIGGLEDLPVDEATGLKWVRYVRVTSLSSYADAMWTAIDAFADVSPALPYENWARVHYPWTDLPNPGVVGKAVVAANGKPNFYNAAFGTAPDSAPVESFSVQSFGIENGRAVFRVPSAEFAFDAFRVGVASGMNGIYENVLPTWKGMTNGNTSAVLSLPVESADTSVFYKVGISAE